MRETDFHNVVKEWLGKYFSNVHHEVTLPSGRRVDFVVETPWQTYAVEVENSTGDLYNGIGQAMVYASETGYKPVIIMPDDGGKPELQGLGLLKDEHTPEIELLDTE